MVGPVCNPSTKKKKQEDQKFKVVSRYLPQLPRTRLGAFLICSEHPSSSSPSPYENIASSSQSSLRTWDGGTKTLVLVIYEMGGLMNAH